MSAGPTPGNEAIAPWVFDSGDGGLILAPPDEYGVSDYGEAPDDPDSSPALRFTTWLFGPHAGQVMRAPLLRRVGDKRAILCAVVDAIGRPASLEGVSAIRLRITPDGEPLAWIAALLEDTLTPFAGANAAVAAALGTLAGDEQLVSVPVDQVVQPPTLGLFRWEPTTEFDAPLSAEVRLELEFSGAPDAVVPSPAPQHLIVRR